MMEKERSVHDNHIIAYSVSAAEKKIVIHTEYRYREPHEFTDIIFEEVLAYYFENDTFDTIILDVWETDLPKLLKECAAMFEYGWNYSWPRGWQKNKEDIESFARRMEMRAFALSAAYGMSGWVLAKRMSTIPASLPA